MYVPEDYASYKYLVSYSDNFVVLTDTRTVSGSWDNPRTISTIIQYFYPSVYTIASTSTITTNRTFELVDTDSDFYSRADCNSIIVSEFLVLFFVLFILNAFTRLFKKGGVFFGS